MTCLSKSNVIITKLCYEKTRSFEGGVGKLFLNYSFVRKFLFLVKIVNCPLPCGTPMFLCFLNNLNKIIEKNFPDGSDAKLNVL